MQRRSYFYLIPCTVVLILLTWISPTVHAADLVGRPVPAFGLPSLFNPEVEVSNRSLKGHVSLLNFWASWCGACRAEMNMLMTIKNTYSIPIYSVNIRDTPDHAKDFLKTYGNPYSAVGVDPNGYTSYDFNIEGTPEMFLVDANGLIRYIFLGAITAEDWNTVLLPKIQQYQQEQRAKITK